MTKRLFAWVLVLAMILTAMPMGVLAEGEKAIPAAHSHSADQHKCAHCDQVVTWEAWGDTNAEKSSVPKGTANTTKHYYLVSDVKTTGKADMAEKSDIVLCLNGYTIDGDGKDTMFRVGGTVKLTITDCTAYTDDDGVLHAGAIKNGKNTGGVGGAFYAHTNAQVSISNCILKDNQNATTTNTESSDAYSGGAIHIRGNAVVNLDTVHFLNNKSAREGGAICMRDATAKLIAKNCLFEGNQAGGLSNSQGGSAIYAKSSYVELENCIFKNNVSAVRAGAVTLRGTNAQLKATGCQFEGNQSVIGAALYAHTATVTVKDCSFEKHQVTGGGSGTAYFYATEVTFDNCTFTDNTSSNSGGVAIYTTYATKLTLKDTTITGNKFTGTSAGSRAAIYLTKAEDQLILQGKTVLENNLVASEGTAPFNRSIFLQAKLAKPIDVGGLTDGAKVEIYSNVAVTEASEIVGAAAAPAKWNRTWVLCENNGNAIEYSAEKGFCFALNTDHVHCECGNSACTDTTHQKVEYLPWNGKTALPANGNYYLNTDVALTGETNVSGDLQLCLNGHTVTAASGKRHISTPADAAVTITISDCTAKTVDGVYTSGGFTGGVDKGSGQGGGAIYIRKGGTLKIYDGTFTNNTSITGGGAINTLANTTLIIYNGLFSGNTAVTADGKSWKNGGAIRTLGDETRILGGTFTENQGNQGGAIYSEAKKFIIKDVAVTDNYSYSNAGGIYAKIGDTSIENVTFTGNYGTKDGGALYYREGKIDVINCVFADNECKTIGAGISFSGNAVATITGGTFETGKATAGGAVVAQGDATVTVKGGTYQNNTGTTYGGAFSLYNGHLIITGDPKITGNTSKRGGAIDLRESSSLVLKDCTITGNTASSGGAVYINEKAVVTLEGAPRIMANQGGNLHLMDAAPITVGTLTNNANVGVAGNPGAFTTACGDYNTQFAADSKYLKVEYLEGALHLAAGGEHKHCLCGGDGIGCDHMNIAWVAWESTNSLPTSGSYYLLGDVKLTAEVSISKDLNLCLNGHTITAASGKRILSTPTGADATISITDCTAATVDGVYTAGKLTSGRDMEGNVGGGAIYLRAGGNLNFYEGILTGNSAVAGGVLLVTTNTVTNIYGGLITENFAKNGEEMGNGGAIYAMKGAEVNVYGGTFTNNDGKSGGAIYIDGDSKLTVSGGLFAGNTAATNAGAIYGKTAAVTITGGTYENNTSVKDGGALYYREGTIEVLGGTFRGNKTTGGAGGAISFSGNAVATIDGAFIEACEGGSGGAMILQGGSNTTINNVTIRDNDSHKYGGGIYLHASTLTVNGGTFSGNNATNRGGAIYACENATLTVNGGTFDVNHADVNGGGIYGIATDMKVTGGQIINNTSLKDGAGIYYREGNMDISGDVLISGNHSNTIGGGVCYSGAATGTISGGIIEKNTTGGSGGGMIIQGQAKVTITGGVIRDHEVKSYGGGIYLYDSELILAGGEITGNKAGTGAGGVYVNKSQAKLTIAEGANINKNQSKNGAGLLAVNLAQVEMTGGKIWGNTTKNGSGGGLYISTNCTFKMTGGSIYSNRVTGAGAGVYLLRSTGTFSGGSITGNYAEGAGGGGIYVNGATAYLYGISITGNEAKATGGGVHSARNTVKKDGVATDYSPRIYMAGAYIANNKAKTGGGMVVSGNGGSLNMTSGTITNNESSGSTGGLYLSAKISVKITGGTISNNTAGTSGGGMYSNKAFGTVENLKLLNNKAMKGAGGAAYLYRGTLIDFKNVIIDGNTACTVGGGVYGDSNTDYYTECMFTDCVFTGNTAGTRGGAFYGSFGVEFDAIGCTFTDNTAIGNGEETGTGNGGAIAIRDIARLKDCTFTGNKAEYGGAFFGGNMQLTYAVNGWGVKADDVAVTMENCTFEGNHASQTGGAIHNAMSSFATLSNVSITGNSAGVQGSAIYAEDDLEMTNTTITDNVAANNGYALYYADSEYDGMNYIRGLFKLGGDIIVKDNQGGNAYFANHVTVVLAGQGFGPKTHMQITLDKGVLTNRLYGAYNYEGGDQVYTVTYGNRSLIEPEVDPELQVLEAQTADDQTQAKSTGDIVLYAGIGVVALAAIAGAVLLIGKKKKSAVAEKK